MRLAANYVAGVFIRDSQGVSTKGHYIGLLDLKPYCIVYIPRRRWFRQMRPCPNECMTLSDAMYAASMLTFALRSFKRIETDTRQYISLIFRRGRLGAANGISSH